MRTIKIIDTQMGLVLGNFKSAFIYSIGDNIVVSERVYVVQETLKYVYQDAEEIEHIGVVSAGIDNNK